jgi:hypothetical protein
MIKNPTISFFRSAASQHTNFVVETGCKNVQNAAFGGTFNVCLEKGPDMTFAPTLEIHLPQLSHEVHDTTIDSNFPYYASCDGTPNPDCANSCSCDGAVPDVIKDLYNCSGEPTDTDFELCCGETLPPYWVSWVQGVGAALFDCIEFKLGSTQIDSYFPELTYAWNEVCGMCCKDIYDMIGIKKSLHELIISSYIDETVLYLPLDFFMKKAALALPLAALMYCQVEFGFTTKPLHQLIVRSHDCVRAVRADGQCIGDSDLSIRLLCHNVYLDVEERAYLADTSPEGGYEVVVRLHDRASFTMTRTLSATIRTEFNHPVAALIMTVQDRRQRAVGNYFNYSGNFGQPILQSWSLTFANHQRFSGLEGYFRLVQPFFFGSKTTKAYVYLYSFGLNCGSEVQFTGSANFSRIQNPTTQVILRSDYDQSVVEVQLSALYYNVLDIQGGTGGLKYT